MVRTDHPISSSQVTCTGASSRSPDVAIYSHPPLVSVSLLNLPQSLSMCLKLAPATTTHHLFTFVFIKCICISALFPSASRPPACLSVCSVSCGHQQTNTSSNNAFSLQFHSIFHLIRPITTNHSLFLSTLYCTVFCFL